MDVEATDILRQRFKQLRNLEHLHGAPDLASHILTRVAAGGSSNGPKVQGGEKAVIPINASAVDDANSIYVLLLKWAIGHARALHVAPPAIALGWSRLEQSPDGFPSWATPTDAAVLVASTVDWLTGWDEAISGLTVAPVYWADVDDALHPLRRRWLPGSRVEVIAGRDCPSCGRRKTIIVNMDDESEAVSCACTFCGWVIPHEYTQKYLGPHPKHVA